MGIEVQIFLVLLLLNLLLLLVLVLSMKLLQFIVNVAYCPLARCPACSRVMAPSVEHDNKWLANEEHEAIWHHHITT